MGKKHALSLMSYLQLDLGIPGEGEPPISYPIN